MRSHFRAPARVPIYLRKLFLSPPDPMPGTGGEFKMTSLNVQLQICEHRDVLLSRKSILSTSYSFASQALSAATTMSSSSSPASSSILTWEADQTENLADFRLVKEAENGLDRRVLARFRNKAFSNEKVGTSEVDTGEELVKDEAVISGLAMLSMMQSINLAGMVMLGGS